MKTHFLLLIVSMMITSLSIAQEPESEPYAGSSRAYGAFGGLFSSLSEFNKSLDESGYHEFDGLNQFELGFRIKNANARWGWAMAYNHLEARNNDQASFTPGALTLQNRTLKSPGFKFSAECYLIDNSAIKLYLPVGILWSKYRVKTFENIPADFSFSNSSGVEENAFTSWKTSADLGLNVDIGILMRHLYATIGVYTGYRYEIGGRPWRYSNELQIDFPELKNQGFFLGFSCSLQGVFRHQETSTQIDI